MNREQTHDLLARLIARISSNTQDEAENMLVEDVNDFLSPQRFARERQQFFLDSPQVIGFAGEVKEPGSFITTEVMGVPVIVAREQDGSLHAMVNACAHRGARVAHGCGNKTTLTCKFHGWSYRHNGELHGRPQAAAFDTADQRCRLKKLPVSERSGLIVVSINPATPQDVVDNHLTGIEDQFSGFGFRDMHTLETRRFEVKANWKIIAALSYESYHFATLHRDSVAQWLKPNCVHDFFGQHSRWSFAMKGTEKLATKERAQWPDTIPGAVSHALFPGTVVITNPEDAQIIRTEPGATPDTAVVYYSGVCRHKDKMESSLAAYDFGGKAFENEDLPAAIECQQGLLAGREQLFIGRNEPVVQFWHRLWRSRLTG